MNKNLRLALPLLILLPLIMTGGSGIWGTFFGKDSLYNRMEKAYGDPEELEEQIKAFDEKEELAPHEETRRGALAQKLNSLERRRRSDFFSKIRWGGFFLIMAAVMVPMVLRKTLPRKPEGEAVPVGINRTAGNPDAQRTAWTPLRGGGSNFRTHVIKAKGPDVLLIKTSGAYRAGFLGFGGIGLFTSLTDAAEAYAGSALSGPPRIWEVLQGLSSTGLLFMAGAAAFYFFLASSSRADRRTRAFYTGRRIYPFSRIRGLQIIGELAGRRSRSGIFSSYELNLVFDDGGRANVMDHGDLDALLRDGRILADFLEVPLWMPEAERETGAL